MAAYCVCPFQNLLREPSDICGRCGLLILHVAIYCFTPFGVYRTSLYTIVPLSFILRGGDACIPVLRSRSTNTPAHTDGRARLRYLLKYTCVAVTVTGGSASSVRFHAAFCSSVLLKRSALHAIYTKYIKMGIDLKAAGC